MTTIAVGCDHAGYNLKTHLAEHLKSRGYEVLDLGSYSADRVDYPEYGAAVGRAVASGEAKYGVCVCGSGVGISIAANKISGVRAALVSDAASAELSRQHNDANVLCFGERSTEFEAAETALMAWLNAEFEGGRHLARVEKLNDLNKLNDWDVLTPREASGRPRSPSRRAADRVRGAVEGVRARLRARRG